MRSPLMSQRGLSGRRRAGHTVSYLFFYMFDNQNGETLFEVELYGVQIDIAPCIAKDLSIFWGR